MPWPPAEDNPASLPDWVFRALMEIGYLRDELPTDKELADGVKAFQAFHGLKVDSECGPKTREALRGRMGFCRVPDSIQDASGRCKWPSGDVSWSIISYVRDIPDEVQLELTHRAFAAWAAVSGLRPKYVENSRSANIVISGGRGRRAQFDGPSGTLAYAYLPCGNQSSVALKFDLDERWVATKSQAGIVYYNVAVHEIGHALGIPHIEVGGETNIMQPTYRRDIDKIGPTDTKSIQIRYGKPEPGRPEPSPPTNAEMTVTVKGKEVYAGPRGRIVIS